LNQKRDFWRSCGHHLLDRDAKGNLLVTDEFLKVYLARPELMPPQDACAAERKLHDAMLSDPRSFVAPSSVAEIVDADARENWELMIGWRDHLVKHRTLEAAYLEITRRNLGVPQLLVGQLTQAILRNALDACEDAFMLRAAEMFFRPQKVTMQQGSATVIDVEKEALLGRQHRAPLAELLGLPVVSEVDMLDDATEASYWERSDRFDMALDLTAERRGMVALGDVIRRWRSHLLAIEVVIEPLSELRNAPFSWYVGLDSEATRIGDALWNGGGLDQETRSRLVGLFRLTFCDPLDVIEKVRGEPVYLLAAVKSDEVLHMKPQNLVTGLPIRHREMVN